MDKERLTAIHNRLQHTTPAPWEAVPWASEFLLRSDWEGREATGQHSIARILANQEGPARTRGNAAFLANARRDVPDLIDALRAAWEERDALREKLGIAYEHAQETARCHAAQIGLHHEREIALEAERDALRQGLGATDAR